MKMSDYYPPGAYNDSNAPYNKGNEKEPINVEVLVSTTLSKNTTIQTSDYTSEKWEEYESDDGSIVNYGGIEYDFSDCNLEKDYEESEWSIPDLLTLLEEYLLKDMEIYKGSKTRENLINNQLKSLRGWIVDEIEVIKEK